MKNGTIQRMKAFNRNKASHKHRLSSCVNVCTGPEEEPRKASFVIPEAHRAARIIWDRKVMLSSNFYLTGKANRQHIFDKNLVKLT